MKRCKFLSAGLLAAAMFLAGFTSAMAESKTVRLLVPQRVQFDALKWSGKPMEGYRSSISTDDCIALDDTKLEGQLRFFVELMVWCQAIKTSGVATNIQLIPFPNLARAFTLLENGEADGFGNTLFQFKVEKKTDILKYTSAVIAIGDFQVGLFTAENRKDILNVRTASELKKLTGITVAHWAIDRKTMGSLGLEKVEHVSRWELIPKMIRGARADFTFSYLDRKEIHRDGAKLVRIDGLKASLQDIRVMMVRRDNDELFNAIQSYISSNTAAIRNAFVLSNFITSKYADWPDVAASSSDGAS